MASGGTRNSRFLVVLRQQMRDRSPSVEVRHLPGAQAGCRSPGARSVKLPTGYPAKGQARLSRGRGAGRQNKAPARCGGGCLSARLDGVHIGTDQQVVNSVTASQSTPRPRDLQAVRRVVRAVKQIPVSSDADRKRRSELEREVAVHSTSALLGSWVYSAFT